MEEFLTDCLLSMRTDWGKLEELKYFLQSHWESEEYYIFSNKTLKGLNDVIRSFSGEKTQHSEYLDILIEFLRFVVVKNKSMSFWNNSGLELGELCVKILILIEKSEVFENLFEKLLTIISKTVEETSNVWKSVSRPILNVFINKNMSFEFLEKAFVIYVSLLEKIEKFEVSNFTGENLSLLKTFFTKVSNVGDFQIQQKMMKIVFLHLNEKILIRSFFHKEELEMFQDMNSNNFEYLCRKYLNEINRRAERRRVYSVGCQTISLRGYQPLFLQDKKIIWVDANKDTRKLTINCAELNNENISIPFSNIRKVENEKTLEGQMRITITSKANENTTENVVFKIHESSEKDAVDLIDFLHEIRKSRKNLGHKLSQTCDLIHINREELEEMGRSNSQSSSKKVQINTITSSIENTFSRPFIDSLNKNIMTSPNKFQKFEKSSKIAVDILKAQKLFSSPSKPVNNMKESKSRDFKNIGKKINGSPAESEKENQPLFLHPSLEFQKKYEDKLFESQSSYQEHFRCENEIQKKKPTWAKLKSKICYSIIKGKDTNKAEEEQKPSLLDPNGYTYKRWLQPTTSKRSNFWLEKLKNLEKEREISRDDFEFSENSNAHARKKRKTKSRSKLFCRKKGKNKKKTFVNCERKSVLEREKAKKFFDKAEKNNAEVKKPEKLGFSLNEITLPRLGEEKENDARNIFKEIETEPENKITSRRYVSRYEEVQWIPKEVQESFDEDIFGDLESCNEKTEVEAVQNEQNKCFDEAMFEEKKYEEEQQLEDINGSHDGIANEEKYKRNEEKDNKAERCFDKDMFEENRDEEEQVLKVTNRNNDGVPNEKKHKRNEEEDNEAERCSFGVKNSEKFLKKRKLKMFPIPLKIKIFQDKIKKAEVRARKETEEIIESVKKATENFFSKLEAKDFTKVKSYLRVLEEVGPGISDPSQILNPGLWLQRFRACYEDRRLFGQAQEILKIRDVLEEFMKNTVNYSRNFVKMYGNLKNVMKKGIEERIKDEVRERSQKLKEMKILELP